MSLARKIKTAVAAYAALSSLERAIHDDEQRRSFVFGQTGHWPPVNPMRAEIERLQNELRVSRTNSELLRHSQNPETM